MSKSVMSTGDRTLRRFVASLTTSACIAMTLGAAAAAASASASPSTSLAPEADGGEGGEGGEGGDGATPSLFRQTMLAVAITDSPTISSNPSMALTGGPEVTTTSKTDHRVYNSTGYLVEQDEMEYSIFAAFSDLQTVFLACISTLVPLIAALVMGFVVRHGWRKYRNGKNGSTGLPWYKGVCSRDDTAESLHHRPHSRSSSIQPATRILSVQDLANGVDGPRYICETEVMSEVVVVKTAMGNGAEYASPINHTSKNTNGNIITLTLKNNHLIVETEERAVTMDDCNKYSDNDCSFVVEAHPGNRNSIRVTDQRAVVHREENPEDIASEFGKTKLFGSTNTGLSQSDLSISSQGSINHNYRYGNQVEYDAAGQFGEFGEFGYGTYGNYGTGDYESDSGSRNLEGGSKWMEIEYSSDTADKHERGGSNKASGIEKWTDADYSSDNDKIERPSDSKYSSIDKDVPEEEQLSLLDKHNSSDASHYSGSSMEQQESTDASNSTDTVRSNPNVRINGETPNKLDGMEPKILNNDSNENKWEQTNKPMITGVVMKDETQEDTFQEQQRKLGNGTLTPEHKNNERSSNNDRKPGGEFATGTFVPTHKRSGSIPPRLIDDSSFDVDRKKSLEIYSQMKTTAKTIIIPGLSPKFELLKNDVSPIEKRDS